VILEKNKKETTEMIAAPNKKTFILYSIEHEKCNARLVIRTWKMRHLQATLAGLLI